MALVCVLFWLHLVELEHIFLPFLFFFLSWDNRSLTINLESSFTIHFFLYGPTTASFYNFDICSFTRRNSTIPLWDSLLISHDCCLISGQDGAFYTALPQIAGRHCLNTTVHWRIFFSLYNFFVAVFHIRLGLCDASEGFFTVLLRFSISSILNRRDGI